MKGFCLEVSGPFACFTRPEMKVERVSYDVITPSAARAIFYSILWKPAIFWNIRRIDVLAPIKWMSVRRNEVAAVASPRKACIYVEDNRQQRAGLFLRDVRYRLYGDFDFIPPDKRMKSVNSLPEGMLSAEDATDIKKDESPAKYAAMFERRARKGQCFNQPYLGCREFSADFRLVNPETEPAEPVQESRDLGWMLYDMDFSDPTDPRPLFFNARMENGVIRVPSRDNKEEVRG